MVTNRSYPQYNSEVSTFIRKVKTKSGATAVQIVYKHGRVVSKIDHIGSAHNYANETLLIEIAKQKILAGQLSLFKEKQSESNILAVKSSAQFLYQTLSQCYDSLGFQSLDDHIFTQLVVARLIEPTSKLDTVRVLSELGLAAPSNTSIHRCLQRVVRNDYRCELSRLCVGAVSPQNLSLLLYDVTTLYFEIQKEDEFRKPGLSKERRLEPQIIVGLLVDRSGFPLGIHEFEGNMAETKTMIPVITQFCKTHQIDTTKVTITADAGMLSANNLMELENARFNFIVGSRIAKTPYQIKEYQKDHLDEELPDGHIFETIQSFGYKKQDKKEYRVIYQYKKKRAQLDLSNIDKQIAKAKRIINGQAPLKKAAFLTITKTQPTLNQDLIEQHKFRAGIKGYVTNLHTTQKDPLHGVSPQEIINAYHQLFQVEKSFRMSKSDLKARPVFHRKLDSIQAHLTIVFAALAIAKTIEAKTGMSIKKFVQALRVVQTPTLLVNGNKIQVQPLVSDQIRSIVENLHKNCGH